MGGSPNSEIKLLKILICDFPTSGFWAKIHYNASAATRRVLERTNARSGSHIVFFLEVQQIINTIGEMKSQHVVFGVSENPGLHRQNTMFSVRSVGQHVRKSSREVATTRLQPTNWTAAKKPGCVGAVFDAMKEEIQTKVESGPCHFQNKPVLWFLSRQENHDCC